ncbi:hypothetical protein RSAG8_02275, partial [Rhizoctonia solani AG-8 WAC10335]
MAATFATTVARAPALDKRRAATRTPCSSSSPELLFKTLLSVLNKLKVFTALVLATSTMSGSRMYAKTLSPSSRARVLLTLSVVVPRALRIRSSNTTAVGMSRSILTASRTSESSIVRAVTAALNTSARLRSATLSPRAESCSLG